MTGDKVHGGMPGTEGGYESVGGAETSTDPTGRARADSGTSTSDEHMSTTSVPDLPQNDPGVPRFVVVAAALVAIGAFWMAARPPEVAPLETMPDVGPPIESAATGDESGGMLFVREGCGSCHATAGPSTALGPTLSGAAGHATDRIRSPAYSGRAEDERGYLREATLDHCADVLPTYECVEVSEVGLRLSAGEIERLVEFMMALHAPESQ